MQSRLRLHLAARIAFLAFLFLPPPVHAQAAPTFPKSWNDAVSQLADNVAAAVSPSTPVTLDIKNLSSLDPSDAHRIASAFQNELQHHSLNLVSAGSLAGRTAIPLHLTLAESTDAYLWTIQIFNNPHDPNSFSTGIVSVSKENISASGIDQPFLSLDKRFVWKQPVEILDFAIVKDSTVGDAALLVLETNRLAVYKLSGAEWVLSHENPIPQTGFPSRDSHGRINLRENSIAITEIRCTGDPDLSVKINCLKLNSRPLPIMGTYLSDLPATIGAILPGTCGGAAPVLSSGRGDWTQPDSMQGYLLNTSTSGPPASLSGNAIQFDGPVLSVEADPETSTGRTVVHNLKTGNYEAYIVTATCSH
jgi:hypothetical protein